MINIFSVLNKDELISALYKSHGQDVGNDCEKEPTSYHCEKKEEEHKLKL